MTRRWKSRPNGSNWGEFGDDDQIGRLNLITNEVRLRAAAEIKQGKCFCLSLPLDFPGGSMLAPHRFAPQIKATQRHDQSYFNYPLSNEGAFGDCGCDDSVLLCTQYSTQWDSLSHIGRLFDVDGEALRGRRLKQGDNLPDHLAHIDAAAPGAAVHTGFGGNHGVAQASGLADQARAGRDCHRGRAADS